MKRRKLTISGQIFLVVWVILCLLIYWMLNKTPIYKPNIINFVNPLACEKENNDLHITSIFKVGQKIYICGHIRLSDPNKKQEMQIRVYEGERSFNEHEIFYSNVIVSNDDKAIPVDVYLLPGNYEIQISDGRRILNTIAIEVID